MKNIKKKIYTAAVTDFTSEIYNKHLAPWLSTLAPTPVH
jgi:hypothetical protein